MDSNHLNFDLSSSHSRHMFFLGGHSSQVFRGARSILGFEEGANRRRPFFTTGDDFLDEEYYDEQLPEKKRRLTPEQVHLLESSFEAENKLEPERKSELAKKLGLQPRQVAVWFQNRRARWKTKQLERDFDRLKSSYDALLTDRETLLKDNDRLRSQVVCLTEKLREEMPPADLHGGERFELCCVKKVESVAEEKVCPPMVPLSTAPPQGTEDRLSTGSRGSSLVNGDGTVPQVDSCGDSYFQESLNKGGAGCCVGGMDRGFGSEDDCGSSDDGCSYLGGGILAETTNQDNWWFWN
ncbi:hypothetical protein HPP92_017609 [Vanilla planifolia]|uniref:Homeobox-leucine zipper protein n=1 Tax=Vanilla planifolia TaxID=51239 RepID=A0A835UM23_VANPL|nr:hypothetical protein HPP92_018222 [Vanilla planifolia]KAG0468281.1 hypothetical protein HPP92_017609 [Vanilla planifolia]